MQPPHKTQLIRGLSLIAAISIVVGNVIGTGVFLKARVMTCNVGTPKMVLFVYVIAGLLSLAGALSYAELAAMMPKAGGEYVFMRAAYGRPWGIVVWVDVVLYRQSRLTSGARGAVRAFLKHHDWRRPGRRLLFHDCVGPS